MSEWGGAQWVMAGLIVLDIILAIVMDGRPRSPTWSGTSSLLNVIMLVTILWWGGFWS
jgi:hypothetical protein